MLIIIQYNKYHIIFHHIILSIITLPKHQNIIIQHNNIIHRADHGVLRVM